MVTEFELKHPGVARIVDRMVENPVGRRVILSTAWLITVVAASLDEDYRLEMIAGMAGDAARYGHLSSWERSRLLLLPKNEQQFAQDLIKDGLQSFQESRTTYIRAITEIVRTVLGRKSVLREGVNYG